MSGSEIDATQFHELKTTVMRQGDKLTSIEVLTRTIAEGQKTSEHSYLELIRELHEHTTAVSLMTERLSTTKESADRMWREHDSLKKEVGNVSERINKFRTESIARDTNLRLICEANQPVIDGVRALNKRVMSIILAALLASIIAPAATVSYVLSQVQKTEKAHESKATGRPAEGNTKQQPR